MVPEIAQTTPPVALTRALLSQGGCIVAGEPFLFGAVSAMTCWGKSPQGHEAMDTELAYTPKDTPRGGGKGKGKVLGRSPNSSVTVIPTCPSQHPFRLAGSQTP